MWVQVDDHRFAIANGATEPLDHIAVDVRRVALDRGGQVEDQRLVGCGLDDLHDGLADADGELRLGEGEALGGVLVADLCAPHRLLELAAQPRGVHGDVDDAVHVESEHDVALQRVGRVVEVHDRPRSALQALVRALDQFGSALHQHLDLDVVGDQVLFDELTDEVEIGLARCWEADLDLLEAHLHEGLEHVPLALRIHRIDQRLVAVTEIDTAPQRRLVDDDVGPGAVV